MSLNSITTREDNNKQELLSIMNRILGDLDTMTDDWNSFFPNREKRPYQIEHIQAVIHGFIEQIEGKIHKKAIAVIAPPAAGKTFEMAILAKLMLQKGIPSIIGMRNATNIHGPDNALQLFQEIFGENNIGIVDAKNIDFSKPITLITSTSFAKKFDEFPQYDQVNIILDEGDTFQTDMRQKALDKLIDKNTSLVSLFSATKLLNKRDITEWTHIVKEMPLIELITLGYAKHIQGYYYTGDITITDENISQGEVDYTTLQPVEKQWLVNSSYSIFQKNSGSKTLIHCNNIEQCRDTYNKLFENNVKVAYITHTTPLDERRLIEDQYIKGDLQVLISAKIYSRGFSEDGVTQTEIFAKISGSLTEVYQTILRGSRPHDIHDTLSIYQLLPSTISTRGFAPVLMHQCFNMDINDLNNRISLSDNDNNFGNKKLPIQFINNNNEIENDNVSNHKNSSDYINYMSKDEIQEILFTKNTSIGINIYIQKNFIDIVDKILQDKQIKILDISNVSLGYVIDTITIGGRKIDLTFNIFCSAVYYLISGNSKSDVNKNIALTQGIIIEWYMKGKPPVYETLQDMFNFSGRKKVTPIRDKYIYEHSLEIFQEFIDKGNIQKERSDKYWSELSSHNYVSIKYGSFLTSILAYHINIDKEMAKNAPVLANDLIWEYKEKGEFPKDVAERFVGHICSLFEYFKWDFLDVYNVFLQKYNFSHEDKNFSFMNDDTIHIAVTKEKFYSYCQYKKLNITQERIEQNFNDDVITSVSIDWRSFARNMLRTTFTPSDLKSLNLTRTDVSKYNGNMQHDLMDLVKKGMLNTSTAIGLLNKKYDNNLYKAYDYYIIQNIDTIVQNNQINIKDTNLDIYYPYIKINNEQAISLNQLSSTFISYIVKKPFKVFCDESNFNMQTFTKYIGLPLLQYYLSIPLEQREQIGNKEILNRIELYQLKLKVIGRKTKTKPKYEIDHEIFQNSLTQLYNWPTIKSNILNILFPDEDTLHKFGLNKDIYFSLSKLLYTDSKKESLIQDIRNKPHSFLNYRLEVRIWEDILSEDNEQEGLGNRNEHLSEANEAIQSINKNDNENSEVQKKETRDKQKLEFETIDHPSYQYATKEEFYKIIYYNFFSGKLGSDRRLYFNKLSETWNAVNVHLRDRKSSISTDKNFQDVKNIIFNFVNKEKVLDMLVPYVKGIAQELEQSFGLSRIKINTTFLKNNNIGIHPYVLSDRGVHQLQTNKNFTNMIQSYIDTLDVDMEEPEVQITDTSSDSEVEIGEEDSIIQEKPLIVDNIINVEEHHESVNIPIYDLYDIPTPMEIQNMISSCITEKGQRNPRQWHIIQTTLDPQRVEILNQLNLDTTHHAIKDIYESLHNRYIRKIYYTADEYNTERRDTAMNSKNYIRIKEYLVAMYSIIDKFLTKAKNAKTYTRDIGREVLRYKAEISDLLGIQHYNEMLDISTDTVENCRADQLSQVVELMDELGQYVKMI